MKKFFINLLIVTFFTVSTQGVSQSISTSSISGSYCQNDNITVDYTVSGSFNTGNTFTAQLSDETGSFAAPENIGTVSGTSSGSISAQLPSLLLSGSDYRVRVVSDQPVVVGSDNGNNIIISGDTNNPAGFGDKIWNVYAYDGNNTNQTQNTYLGMYTHAGVDFNSTDKWGTADSPSSATGYVGCDVPVNNFSMRYKRRGFPCGSYQIDLTSTTTGQAAGHDDGVTLFIDGVQQYNNNGCCSPRFNIWSGFLGPNSEVELFLREQAGNAYLRAMFVPQNQLEVSKDATVCPGVDYVIRATGGSTYDWSQNTTHVAGAVNEDSLIVNAPPSAGGTSETYYVLATDTLSGCTAVDSLTLTFDTSVVVQMSDTLFDECGFNFSKQVVATGAIDYTWSPSSGVSNSSAKGDTVTLSASSSTTFTVVGTNGCKFDTQTVEFQIFTPPGDPNDFGDNRWNVYSYDGNNFQDYRGFYFETGLDFDSRNVWNGNRSPSHAPNYVGCDIPDNYHSYRYKRKGFPCGYYQLDIPNHDDDVQLIVNGNVEFSQNSWFSNNYKTDLWRGYLGPESTIEYTIKENTGGSHAGLAFIPLFGPDHDSDERVWGGDSNSLWEVSQNWCGGIPGGTNPVLIPDNVNNVSVNSSTAEAKSLEVMNTRSVTVKGNASLEIQDEIENNGTITVEHNGSLIQGGSADNNTGSGTYKIEREGKSANNAFNAWSSPVAGLPVHDNGVFSDANPCDIFVFDASKQNWSHDFAPNYSTTCNGNSVTFTSNFLISGADGILSTARGYFVPGAAGITRTFEGGSVHNGNISTSIQSGNNPGTPSINWTQNDWNLIGNPYPSAIDIHTFLTENTSELTSGAVYIWDDAGSGNYHTNDFIAHNLSGATAIGGGSNTITKGNIASCQGFYVQGNGNITFTNAMRASGNDEFRSGDFDQSPMPRLWLSVSDSTRYNELLVAFTPEATFEFDKLYDAPKRYGQYDLNIAAQLESKEEMIILGEPKLGINEERILPLTFQTSSTQTVQFGINRSELIPENVQIFLIDSLHNTQNELSNGGSYTPQLDTAGKYTNRFYLLFKNNLTAADDDFSDSGNNDVTGMEEKKSRETVKVWSRRDDAVVEAKGVELKSASLIDASGRLIITQRAERDNRMLLNTSGLSSGIYMVRTVDQKGETRVNKVALTR